MDSNEKREVVDSACCRCRTPILAQVVPDGMEFIVRNKTTKEQNSFKAIEWCPHCNEIHVMEEIPNPETRRFAKDSKVGSNQMEMPFCDECKGKEQFTGMARIKQLIEFESETKNMINTEEFLKKYNVDEEQFMDACDELGLDFYNE